MRRLSLRLLVSLLTFAIGITVSGLWLFGNRLFSEMKEESISQQPLTFSSTMHACGPTSNHHTYVASDGVSISLSNEEFPSDKLAAKELQKKLESANEIIERRPELDSSGRKMGERVVAMFGNRVVVFRLWGNFLRSTESSSLKHILEFEKR
jgi:hypothetical protein